jgi:hypothetical protein
MLLNELLDAAAGDLAVQVDVKAHGNPGLARASAAAVCRVAGTLADHGRAEVLKNEISSRAVAQCRCPPSSYMTRSLARS